MPRRIAILDTNVLDYGFKDKYASSVALLLKELEKDYDLVTTQYSRFELFRGLKMGKIPKAKTLFDLFTCLDIDRDVFRIAAALSTCYINDLATKNTKFSDGDIIIATTGFVNNALIVTCNVNDFPRPYFLEVSRDYKHLASDDDSTHIRVQVLEPDIRYLNEKINLLYPV